MSNLLIAAQVADCALLGALYYISVRRLGDWLTLAWALAYGLMLEGMFPGEGERQAKIIAAFAVELLAATVLAVQYTIAQLRSST